MLINLLELVNIIQLVLIFSGFSYADYKKDYVTDEFQIANDMYNFMQEFYSLYPQYYNLDFYITGESYAGILSIQL
jgi:carboxypeptidase C (cathepsin A)